MFNKLSLGWQQVWSKLKGSFKYIVLNDCEMVKGVVAVFVVNRKERLIDWSCVQRDKPICEVTNPRQTTLLWQAKLYWMLAFGRQKHLYYSLDTNSHHATNRLKQKTTLKRMLDCYDCKLKSTYKLQTLKNGVYTQLFIKRKTFFFCSAN